VIVAGHVVLQPGARPTTVVDEAMARARGGFRCALDWPESELCQLGPSRRGAAALTR